MRALTSTGWPTLHANAETNYCNTDIDLSKSIVPVVKKNRYGRKMMGKNKELNRKLKKLAGPPYRTPACDDHLSNNEDDECPWCRIEQLETEIGDQKPIALKFEANGQVWITADPGGGQQAMINLNNIFLSHSKKGFTREILLNALTKCKHPPEDKT